MTMEGIPGHEPALWNVFRPAVAAAGAALEEEA